jgi:multidrug efflux pump subunit AcrA (membrane-fusion protein)
MRRFITRRFLIGYAVIVVVLGTGAFMLTRGGAAAAQYRTASATLGTVTQSISMSGNLASAAESDLNFGSAGKVDAINIQVGQTVTAGQALASLDTSSLQASLSQAQANLSSAQAKLALDQQGATAASLESSRAQINSDEVQLQNAETAYRDTVAANNAKACGNPPAAGCMNTAEIQQSDDQAQAQVASAKVNLQNAEAALSVLEQGSTPQQIQMDQSEVQIARVNVTSAQTALNQATLTAPVDGVVAAVNVSVGEQVGSSGASSSSSSSSSPAIVVLTPGLFEVTGTVSDAQVNEVAVGQQAQVVPAGSQEAIPGKVTQVAEEATVTSGVATFPVTVLLNGTNNSLRVGMSASVSIVVNQVVQVLTVPTSAVHTTAAGSTVTVLVDGKPTPRAVTVGASDATRTQILSGLNAGDQVVIATVTSSIPTSGSGSGARAFGGGFGGGFAGGGRGGGGGAVTGG